jgi:Tfp pilus assembly protein PilN
MVVVGGAILGLLLFIYGVEWMRIFWLGRRFVSLTHEVSQLKEEREKVLKQVEWASGGASGSSALIGLFQESFSWSQTLQRLTFEAPPALWLTGIKSHDRTDVPSKKGLSLKGQTENAEEMTQFLKALDRSPSFDKVLLASSRKETGPRGTLYSFEMEVAVGPDSQGGP